MALRSIRISSHVELSIRTLRNHAGGTVDKGEELSPKDVWNQPTDIPSINKTFQCETLPKKGKKVVYTVVNGKIAALHTYPS